MATCSVRWRPSGGRGEFEFVPSDSLLDREITVYFEHLDVSIPAEVRGEHAQGKPRLRKFDKNNRKKLHLPQLVMAVAGLPEPAREDHFEGVKFPLENKAFVMESMDFDVITDDALSVTLAPLCVSILHSDVVINLNDRLRAIAEDVHHLDDIQVQRPGLAGAIAAHVSEVANGINSTVIRKTADRVIQMKTDSFGYTNAGSALELTKVADAPETDFEEIYGKEGRILVRIHTYRERDRAFAKRVLKDYIKRCGGKLVCEACEMVPTKRYGDGGDKSIEVHHKIPIEELQPDSITQTKDMAVICANCHRVVHSQKPCLTVDEVRAKIQQSSA